MLVSHLNLKHPTACQIDIRIEVPVIEIMTDMPLEEAEAIYRFGEAQSELGRHHTDFDAISDIVHESLASAHGCDAGGHVLENGLKRIRNIVG